ncbi:MAG: FAD-dependent oxidoreductase [Polyangiales bacterium]
MIIDDLSNLPARGSRRRTVILGSGAIGLHLAAQLVGRGLDVVVVEAGRSRLGQFSPDSWASIGQPHGGIKLGRSRSVGGTTNLWGGQLVEFQPIDFDGREWLPGSRWPIRHAEVAPYYAKTFEALGFDEHSRVDENVWRDIGASPPDLGDDLEVFLTRWMRVPNFAELYARTLERDENVKLLTGLTAVGFRGGARITHVRVVDEAGRSHTIAGDDFVLATGTIENARLLLAAQIDDELSCPWRENRNVGGLFQDHFGGCVANITPTNPKKFFDTYCTIVSRGFKYQPKMRLRDDVQRRVAIHNIQGLVAFESAASEHLVYLKQFLRAAVFRRKISTEGGGVAGLFAGFKYLLPLMWRYVADHRVFVPSTSKVKLLVQAEQEPCARSRLTVDGSHRDAYGLPRVVLDWQWSGAEVESLREFTLRVGRALRDAGLATLEIDPLLLAADPKFLTTLTDTIHQTGGAVMGDSAADGVVDRDLRVFGTENLFVGGASTFRTNSNANVTFTALALATRLADHLAAHRDGAP